MQHGSHQCQTRHLYLSNTSHLPEAVTVLPSNLLSKGEDEELMTDISALYTCAPSNPQDCWPNYLRVDWGGTHTWPNCRSMNVSSLPVPHPPTIAWLFSVPCQLAFVHTSSLHNNTDMCLSMCLEQESVMNTSTSQTAISAVVQMRQEFWLWFVIAMRDVNRRIKWRCLLLPVEHRPRIHHVHVAWLCLCSSMS